MIQFPSINSNDSEQSIGLLFMRVYNQWHTKIKTALSTINLTHPQFVVLTSLAYLLQTNDEVTQVMIANLSGMDVMTISQVLTTLEKKAFVVRTKHSLDTRAKAVFLTNEGQDIVVKAIPLVEAIDQTYFGVLKKEENQFMNLLKQLSETK